MLYAIVENGGKQYKAVEGSTLELDLLPEEVGEKKTFDKVLLLVDDDKVEVGSPFLKSVSVDATVMEHFKGSKITVFKYRAKQRYRVKTGHRQLYTRVVIDSIAFPGKKAKPAKATAEKSKPAAKKPAARKAASTTKKTTSAAKKTTAKAAAVKKPAAKKTTTAAKKTTTKKTEDKK